MLNPYRSVKGSPRDIPFVLVLVFVISLSGIAMYGLTSEAHTQFESLNKTTNISGMSQATKFMGNTVQVFSLVDVGVVVMWGMFFLGSIYSALQVEASRIFVVPSFFFLVASLYLAGILGDAFLMIGNSTSMIQGWFNFFGLSVKFHRMIGLLTGVAGTVLFIATYFHTQGVQEVGL